MSAGAIKPRAGSRPGIVGVGETPMLRHPEPGCSTAGLLARAIGLALADAGVAPREVDGLGVASFSLRPDRAIDLGWRLGLKLNWCMQDEMGGASAINLLRQAWLALEAGRPALSCWRPAIISPARIPGPGQRLQP